MGIESEIFNMSIIKGVSVFKIIEDGVTTVTDEDLRRVQRSMSPVKSGDKIMGVLEDEHVRRLWALGFIYTGLRNQYSNMALFESRDEAEQIEMTQTAARYHQLATFARAAFAAEAKNILGGDAWEANELAVREGFTLACPKKSSSPVDFLRALGLEGGE